MDEQRDAARHQPVIVGVVPGEPESVLNCAAEIAAGLDAELICAHVDAGRYPVEEQTDGSIISLPFDPDLPEMGEEVFNPALAAQIEHVLHNHAVRRSNRALAGEPARALAQLAETLDARLIVVGIREGGLRSGILEFFTGSVAVHLSHRQHRPVLVVPLSPVVDDQELRLGA